MFKVNNKNTRMTSKIVNGVSLVDFEQVNASWGAVPEIFDTCLFGFH